jgi:hypothetical protein
VAFFFLRYFTLINYLIFIFIIIVYFYFFMIYEIC